MNNNNGADAFIGKKVMLSNYGWKRPEMIVITDIQVSPALPVPGDFTWPGKAQTWFFAKYDSKPKL